jgi:hypothetical protein
MAEPNVIAMSRLFTDLVNTKVLFAPTRVPGKSTQKQMLGVYSVSLGDKPLVVSADLRLLGSFAGALTGLPDSAVTEHLAATSLDEVMRDAIHEVLNIASTVVTAKGRAVFRHMAAQAADIDLEARQVLNSPTLRHSYDVSIQGYQGGKFSILAPHYA